VDFGLEGADPPAAGQRQLLVDSADRPVAIVETVECRVVRLADADDHHAIDEGEGDADAAEFRNAHEQYWKGYIESVRAGLGDPGFRLTDDTMVVLERFRIVERLDPDATDQTRPGPLRRS
jgi:uncharacterized protein YhfF